MINRFKKVKIYNIPRYISYSYFGLSVVVCTTFLYFFIRPTLVEALQLSKTIEQGKEIDQKLTLKLENLAKAENMINEHKSTVPLIDLALPDFLDSADYIDRITAIAEINDINIDSINADNNTQQNSIAYIISFNGDHTNILNFIDEIEHNPQLFSTNNLILNSLDQVYSATMTITAYSYLYDPSQIGTTIVPFRGEEK